MTELLANFFAGRWQVGTSTGTPLTDPLNGKELVHIDSSGLDLSEGFSFAREQGGKALREMTYSQRGSMLSEAVKILQANRKKYYEISTANSGTVKNDSAVDIEGGLFTLGHYARMGDSLGDRHFLLDGEAARLGKDPLFQSQHILTPNRGLALFINAFNFPSWGLWEKAAPALLSGVPVIVKPASSTAWLTQVMVKDIIDANILPLGSLSIVCGSAAGLMDQLEAFDVVSFTGSAETAALIRSHPAVAEHSVRVNIEADSINSALLLPNEASDSIAFELLAKEVAKEMTVKSGQKCTAIRRIFVPENLYDAAASAISARLSKVTIGDPRNEAIRMGSVVNQAQLKSINEGLARLQSQTETLYDGASQSSVMENMPETACCIAPTLLGVKVTEAAEITHNTEVFGPVATLFAYTDIDHALSMIRQGKGSLVTSLYGSDSEMLATISIELADSNGRVHVISPDVASLHTGHGNVMPQSLHGGPGRAGGGEELGDARALNFYHQRSAIQASTEVLKQF